MYGPNVYFAYIGRYMYCTYIHTVVWPSLKNNKTYFRYNSCDESEKTALNERTFLR